MGSQGGPQGGPSGSFEIWLVPKRTYVRNEACSSKIISLSLFDGSVWAEWVSKGSVAEGLIK